ncbi:hypothetical protein [Sorangium sp. So ce1389]|uniref:hypothetical protein n=1 Tax=Sorangium sp. So ce1389 TaxID=3133336 RepID=UPI003F64048A
MRPSPIALLMMAFALPACGGSAASEVASAPPPPPPVAASSPSTSAAPVASAAPAAPPAAPLPVLRGVDVYGTDKEDKDPEDRGAAAFLLAHIKDGEKLVSLMLPMLNDPDALVRNNAMRVLMDVAMLHHDVSIPLTPFLKALDGPTTTDRNKAAAVTWGLIDRPEGTKLYAQVIKEAGPTLLKLLKLEQPNNHDAAYRILKKVSGKDFPERDHAAWEKWLAAAA